MRTSSLRGLGGPVNTYANECFIDELAELAGEDPVAFRLAHDLRSAGAACVVERTARDGRLGRIAGPAGTGAGLGFAYCRYRDRGAYVAVRPRR